MNSDLEAKERTFVVLRGLPRAGKSTVANQIVRMRGLWIGRGFKSLVKPAIVSRDSIRLALHGKPFVPELEDEVTRIQIMMIKALFASGHSTIILDECHMNMGSGKHVLNHFPDVTHIFYDLNTPKEVCIQRALATNQAYLIPVIERMARGEETKHGYPCE